MAGGTAEVAAAAAAAAEGVRADVLSCDEVGGGELDGAGLFTCSCKYRVSKQQGYDENTEKRMRGDGGATIKRERLAGDARDAASVTIGGGDSVAMRSFERRREGGIKESGEVTIRLLRRMWQTARASTSAMLER